MLPAIIHAQQTVLLFKEKGIKHIVISPGSRNAPLTIGFTQNPYFKCYSIVDERCASHFALGIAQQLQQPVAIACTSGSALLNYYPAVTEAFYSQIPLIVLSADRPEYKIDIGDGQTIRQQNVYSNHILYHTQLKEINSLDDKALTHNNECINEAINIAIEQSGPVHINIPFEEPLYNCTNNQLVNPSVNNPRLINENQISRDFINSWNSSQRKLVVLSTLYPETISSQDLGNLLLDPSVLVMSEVSSNVVHNDIVWSIDTLIAPLENDAESLERLRPQLIITIGGMIVSKKIKQFLRSCDNAVHYHIGHNKAYDTFFKLKDHIKIKPSTWIKSIIVSQRENNYQEYGLSLFKTYINKRDKYLQDIPWSDFKAFELIFNNLPENINLQLGNSSTIRYAQLFKMHDTNRVFSNRGTSGIDGSTSTAVGSAVVNENPTIFITGDLSFFYDSNALWNNYIPRHFKIIIVNNSGGGIFRILPGDKTQSNFETFFETTHHLDASHLCKMYDVGYHSVDSEYAFAKAYSKFITDHSKPQLLEIFTPRLENDTVLLNYFKILK